MSVDAGMRAAAKKKLEQRNTNIDAKGKGFKAIAKKVAAKKTQSLPPWLQKGK